MESNQPRVLQGSPLGRGHEQGDLPERGSPAKAGAGSIPAGELGGLACSGVERELAEPQCVGILVEMSQGIEGQILKDFAYHVGKMDPQSPCTLGTVAKFSPLLPQCLSDLPFSAFAFPALLSNSAGPPVSRLASSSPPSSC